MIHSRQLLWSHCWLKHCPISTNKTSFVFIFRRICQNIFNRRITTFLIGSCLWFCSRFTHYCKRITLRFLNNDVSNHIRKILGLRTFKTTSHFLSVYICNSTRTFSGLIENHAPTITQLGIREPTTIDVPRRTPQCTRRTSDRRQSTAQSAAAHTAAAHSAPYSSATRS